MQSPDNLSGGTGHFGHVLKNTGVAMGLANWAKSLGHQSKGGPKDGCFN